MLFLVTSTTALAISGTTSVNENVTRDSNTSYSATASNLAAAAGEITIAFNDTIVTGEQLNVSAEASGDPNKITYDGSKITIGTGATADTYTLTFSPKNTTDYEGTVEVTITIS